MMLWRGTGDDQGLWWSVNPNAANVTGFEPQQPLPRTASASSPALAYHEGVVYAAWRGWNDDESLWWATWAPGRNWTEQRMIPWVGSSHGPCLVSAPDGLHMFWKGKAGNENATKVYASVLRDGAWAEQEEVRQVADVQWDRADDRVEATLTSLESITTPSACVRNGTLLLAVIKGDESISLTYRHPLTSRTAGVEGRWAWSGGLTLGARSSHTIGMAARRGRLVLAFRGRGDDRSCHAMAIGGTEP